MWLMSMEIDKLVKAALEAKIIEAFKTAPEAIDALVSACLEQPVDAYGNKPGYGSSTMPYLTYLARDTIRNVAKTAVTEYVDSITDTIKGAVKRKLNEDVIVDAFTKAMLSGLENSWSVKVEFTK